MAKLDGVLRKAGLARSNRQRVEQEARDEIGTDGSAPAADGAAGSDDQEAAVASAPQEMSRPRAKASPRSRKRDASREQAAQAEPASGRARTRQGAPAYVEPEERYGDSVRPGEDGEPVTVFPAGRYNPPPVEPERHDDENGPYMPGFRQRAADRSGVRIT